MLHEEKLAIGNRRQMVETARLIVTDIFAICLPINAIRGIGNNDMEFFNSESIVSKRVAVFDFRVGSKAAFYPGQGVEGIVPVLTKGLGMASKFFVDAILDTKEQVAPTTGTVVNFEEGVGFFGFGGNDFGNEGDNIVRGVLITGRFGRDVSPFAFNVFFKGGDGRVVEGFEVNLAPLFGIAEENIFGFETGDDAFDVEKGFAFNGVYTKQVAGFAVEGVKVSLEIYLERFVVEADLFEGFVLLEDVGVVTLASVLDHFYKVAVVNIEALFYDFGSFFVKHTNKATFDHDQGEEGHHVGRPVGCLDAGAAQKVGGVPDGGFVLEDIARHEFASAPLLAKK